jgi:hypothetical protein
MTSELNAKIGASTELFPTTKNADLDEDDRHSKKRNWPHQGLYHGPSLD